MSSLCFLGKVYLTSWEIQPGESEYWHLLVDIYMVKLCVTALGITREENTMSFVSVVGYYLKWKSYSTTSNAENVLNPWV